MPKHKILIVDDEVNTLKSLQRLFAYENYELLVTSSPEFVQNHLKNDKISVILCDQRMPLMDGTQLLKIAREISPKTVRILLTGYVDAQVAIDAINLAAVHRYLTKPWDDKELLSIVRESSDHYASAWEEEDSGGEVSLPQKSKRKPEDGLKLEELEPGMVLSREMRTERNLLLLPENAELTHFRIERLKALQRRDPIRGRIFVYRRPGSPAS